MLIGQSTGAADVAAYIGGGTHTTTAAASLAGAIMLSGSYDIGSPDRNGLQTAYHGDDSGRFVARVTSQSTA